MAWKSLYPVLLLLLLPHAGASGSESISQVELVGGHSSCEGRLEVTYLGTRGSVCPDNWNIWHAAVVCAQLGCGPAREALTETRFGAGQGEHCLSNIDCFGTEKELSDCRLSIFSWVSTDHKWDAGVVCSPDAISNATLINGPNKCKGHLKVTVGSKSGAVCSKAWGSQDNAVVCKELKCGAAMEMPRDGPTVPSPSGNKLLTSAFCSGSESQLSKCGAQMESGTAACAEFGEAEVSCAPNSGSLGLRLMDGVSSCDGRVEVQYDGTWGSVSRFHWDMAEAQVVCRQLRCGEARRVMLDSHFGPGPDVMWLKATYCSGSETQLSDCGLLISSRMPPSDPRDTVGIICEGPLSTWGKAFLVVRGTFYFIVYAMIHLVYFIVGKRSSRLREERLKSVEALEEEVVV
ncbi:deleted in malignant brain tumors 1 protein [Microcaecilia unicolor]|uniref:Deleted in malignant brain tumors 1 protein-like n=1 Tax=Microcaecilia unicolor TaxID=1415580 RepID=A0A6P7WLT3_9AMPH|nr:deleted in malignant brain tumors 1 protein-like [Microcaecilia unicolor]